VRVRSQTVYYILTRMKSVCKVWLNRERAGANFGGRAGCRV
jgi:cysteine desulfuration protein SufE